MLLELWGVNGRGYNQVQAISGQFATSGHADRDRRGRIDAESLRFSLCTEIGSRGPQAIVLPATENGAVKRRIVRNQGHQRVRRWQIDLRQPKLGYNRGR